MENRKSRKNSSNNGDGEEKGKEEIIGYPVGVEKINQEPIEEIMKEIYGKHYKKIKKINKKCWDKFLNKKPSLWKRFLTCLKLK